MRVFVFAFIIALIPTAFGYGLAMHKIKSNPVTVYIVDADKEYDINNLPLPPLEELTK